MRALGLLLICAAVSVLSLPALATTVFSIDSGTANDTAMTNWQTSQMMWLNAFDTGSQTVDINQMSVAFPNNLPAYQGQTKDPHLTAGTTVYMDLYSDGPSQLGNPSDPGVTLLYETSFTYPASNFPDSSTFLPVSVPGVSVTGKFFVGVTALAREDLGLSEYDEDAPSLTYGGDSSKSWVIYENQGDTSAINRDSLSGNANVLPYTFFGSPGVNMIRAAGDPIPEPMTMASVFMALGSLGCWVRRRAKLGA
jgi:hypothetical protein